MIPMSEDPKVRRVPDDDDVVTGLPELDGDGGEVCEHLVVPLALDEEQTVDLDDAVASEEVAEALAEAMLDTLADIEADGWETSESDPVEADEALVEGEGERWSDRAGDAARDEVGVDELDVPEEPNGPRDDGAEGLAEGGDPELDISERDAEVTGPETYPEDGDLGLDRELTERPPLARGDED